MITFTNGFHHTSAKARIEVGQALSATQVRRLRRKLCGIKGCECGGGLVGEQGQQERADGRWILLAQEGGEVMVRLYPLEGFVRRKLST